MSGAHGTGPWVEGCWPESSAGVMLRSIEA